MALEIVEGWTGPIDLQCDADGAAADFTGKTVTLVLERKDGVAVNTSGKLAVLGTATLGQVRYSPGSSDLLRIYSPYRARVQAVDGANKVVYFPSGSSDAWTVYRP